MKKVKYVDEKNNYQIEINNVKELEYFELYPKINEHNITSTKTIKPRAFFQLQHRLLCSLRSLIKADTTKVCMVCANFCTDNGSLINNALSSLNVQSKFLNCPNKLELFGKNEDGLLFTTDKIIILDGAYLLDKYKFIYNIKRALEKNQKLKLVVFANAIDCAQLSQLDDIFYNAISTDIVYEFTNLNSIYTIGSLLANYVQEFKLKDFDAKAIELIHRYCSRQAGDHRYIGIFENSLIKLVKDANSFAKGELISIKDVIKALAKKDFIENYIAQNDLRDHKDEQILITTKGSCIGQINGLSVIQTAGLNYEFGSPVRISATYRAGGEGDVVDIERKAELAGQIHAKAMMIINGYLTKEFGSQSPLPITASLVFEQSYSEIDGDSASLTGLCAVISSISSIPLRQDLAVTGAVDQFGDVQSVGGINEKIEGFFKVCQLNGLTKTQGVVIPHSCIYQLCLKPSIIKAVKNGDFHIYTVKHVKEAMELLTAVPWGDSQKEDSIYGSIVSTLMDISSSQEYPWWMFWKR